MARPSISSRKRTVLLCYAYLLSFAFVLMAFEYQVPIFTPQETEWEDQEVFEAFEPAPPERPEPGSKGKEREKDRPTDPSLEPENRKDENSKGKEDLDEDFLDMKGMDDGKDVDEADIPKYRDPDKPVQRHELSRRAVFQGCAHLKDKKERWDCSNELLVDHLRDRTDYPEILREQDIEGKAHLSFIVGRNGKVRDVKVVQSSHPAFKKALKKAVKELPPFVPAEQNGRRVSTRVSTPVNFSLR